MFYFELDILCVCYFIETIASPTRTAPSPAWPPPTPAISASRSAQHQFVKCNNDPVTEYIFMTIYDKY